MTKETDKEEATRITLIGALLDLTLGFLKIIVGTLANSFALVSDGVHSLSDLLTDAFVLIITRLSHEEPDTEHPYGHGRFETIGTIIIGIVLVSVAGVIGFDSIRRLSSSSSLDIPGWLALLVAIVSILGKEWIFRYTRQIANKLNSSLLLANAWHSRTDALSSVAVLIGIIGARSGYPWMEVLAAIFVALMIARIAWSLISSSLKELVDTALPEADTEAISQYILSMEGINGVHSLRSRLHGGKTFLDIHVQVNSKISVSEGHYLGDFLCASLKKRFANIADMVIHIDPELDTDELAAELPLRQEVVKTLLNCWQGVITEEQVEKIILHYLEEKIQAEVYINNIIEDKEIIEKLNKLSEDLNWLESIKIYGIF